MLSSKLLDGRWHAATVSHEGAVGRPAFWLPAVYAVILGTLSFNFFLAFVNTNVFGIRESHVVLSELLLISAGLVLILDRKAGFYVLLAVFLSYMAFILALRPELDLKAIRDALIPLIFYGLGRKLHNVEEADRIIFVCAGIVLFVGLFEFLMLDVFTSVVNIFDYYVARGTVAADSNFVKDSTLFVSSTRIGGRNFFPFLGTIRASSVFLEPVTMGNFGAFLCLWAVFRNGMKNRWLMFVMAFVIIVLGDARFGMFVCVAFFAVAPIYRFVPRSVLFLMPFFGALVLAMYGGWTNAVDWPDNLPGRILHSALLMIKLDWQGVLGISGEVGFVADNGFAYTFSQIGLMGALFLWALFIFAAPESGQAHKFKVLATAFICLLLVVSNSIYSIKLAALFWLAAGAADLKPAMPLPVSAMRRA